MFAAHTKWKSFADTLVTTYAAKKRSEVAPGVGTATDMFYIGPNLGSYSGVGSHVLARLQSIYREEQKKQKAARQKSLEQTNDYIEELTRAATAKEQSETPKDSGNPPSPDNADNVEGQPSKKDEKPPEKN